MGSVARLTESLLNSWRSGGIRIEGAKGERVGEIKDLLNAYLSVCLFSRNQK